MAIHLDEMAPDIRTANRLSIVDFARKNGFEIKYEDYNDAITTNPHTKNQVRIEKENNVWFEEDGMGNELTRGNTVRFAIMRMDLLGRDLEEQDWQGVKESLLGADISYLTREEYNAGYIKSREISQQPLPRVSQGGPNMMPPPFPQSPMGVQMPYHNSNVFVGGMNPPNPYQQGTPVPPFQQNEYRRTLDKRQFAEVLAGIKKGIDPSDYDKVNLSPEQMREVRLGKQNGIDTSAYNFPFVPAEYMREVRLASEQRLDISLIEIKGNQCPYDANQAREIRKGLKNGLSMEEVNLYAKSNVVSDVQKEMRLGLQDGLHQMKNLHLENYSAKDIQSIRIALLVDKILEAVASRARALYEKILELFHKIIERNLYEVNKNNENPAQNHDMEEEANREMKDAATRIYKEMDDSLGELPMDKKVIAFTDVVQRVISKAAAMEQSMDAEPSVIMEQSINEVIEAQAEFALEQQAAENLMDEYVSAFNHQEESYNISHIEFSSKVMNDHGLTEEQKTEIIKETLGSMYGEAVAEIWIERITQESKLLQEQVRARIIRQEYELLTEIQKEMEYSMEP